MAGKKPEVQPDWEDATVDKITLHTEPATDRRPTLEIWFYEIKTESKIYLVQQRPFMRSNLASEKPLFVIEGGHTKCFYKAIHGGFSKGQYLVFPDTRSKKTGALAYAEIVTIKNREP